MQRNWIGRSEGIAVNFSVLDENASTVSIFTTRPDTLMGVTYLAIAPAHPLAKQASAHNAAIAEFCEHCKNIKVSEAEIATMEKLGIDTGLQAEHPITGEKLPIWIANFVIMSYGAGGANANPAHRIGHLLGSGFISGIIVTGRK